MRDVITVPADVLTSNSARPPASTDITMYTDRFSFNCYVDGLVQQRRNSIANVLELHLFSTNPLICNHDLIITIFLHLILLLCIITVTSLEHGMVDILQNSSVELQNIQNLRKSAEPH